MWLGGEVEGRLGIGKMGSRRLGEAAHSAPQGVRGAKWELEQILADR